MDSVAQAAPGAVSAIYPRRYIRRRVFSERVNEGPPRKITNPLALAVLSLLGEGPMHPYEMSRTMRERGKEHSIKINYGSLYSVIDQLLRHGAIESQETTREGRRPERTIYRITSDGRAMFDEWLTDLLRRPAKEYSQFEAGLSLMPSLPPDSVVALLEERAGRLDESIAVWRARFDELRARLPRLLWIEHDYEVSQQEAELAFVRRLIAEIKNGELDGLELWHSVAAEGQWAEIPAPGPDST